MLKLTYNQTENHSVGISELVADLLLIRYKLSLGGIKAVQYTRVFRNPEGMIFNTSAPLSIKLIRR